MHYSLNSIQSPIDPNCAKNKLRWPANLLWWKCPSKILKAMRACKWHLIYEIALCQLTILQKWLIVQLIQWKGVPSLLPQDTKYICIFWGFTSEHLIDCDVWQPFVQNCVWSRPSQVKQVLPRNNSLLKDQVRQGRRNGGGRWETCLNICWNLVLPVQDYRVKVGQGIPNA